VYDDLYSPAANIVAAMDRIADPIDKWLTSISTRLEELIEATRFNADVLQATVAALLEQPGARITIWRNAEGLLMAQVMEPRDDREGYSAGWSASGRGLYSAADCLMELLAMKLASGAALEDPELPF